MSNIESDVGTPGRGRKSVGWKDDVTDELPARTPNRSKRINLGTPGNYYFKYMNSGKKNGDISFAKDEGDTGEISIPGFKYNATPSKGDASFFSIAGSSTGSEASDDMLNKSTLSDTTELTASNFVLVSTSKLLSRKTRDSIAREDKENALNRKLSAVENKPLPMAEGNSAVEKKQGEKADAKDQGDGIAETKDDSKLKNDNIEEAHVSHQKSSVRGASPSLRSRISSSPASLRRFHENLKNSRMQRQIQREEDTKRRLSIEGSDTLDSISAQLEALTGGGLPRRDKLPPQSSQQSPSEKSTSGSSQKSSPAGDDTATMDIDLDAFLGMESSQTTESPPAATVDETETTPMSNEKSKSTFETEEDQQETSVPKSVPVAQDAQPEFASPPMASPPDERSITSNARKRMTPTKLNSTPRRVVNPDSLFSPARNTRSATKKRKLEEQKQAALSAEKVVKSRRSSSIGTRLFQMTSLSDNDTSMDSDSSDKEGGLNTSHDDDTASLGDIANLFGIGKSTDESFESSMSPGSEKKLRASNGQETASIGDINEILNVGVSHIDHSPEQKSFESPPSVGDQTSQVKKQRRSSGQETASIGDIKAILNEAVQDSPKQESFDSPPTRKDQTSEMPQSLTSDQKDASLDSKDSQKNDESMKMEDANGVDSLNLSNEENTPPPNQSTADEKKSTSTTKENYESPVESQKSPVRSINSEQRNSGIGSLDGSQSATKLIPKSPIRLTPNKHRKPTPSKLTPIPRRVMNPKNPNSPARNTRSSAKKDKIREDDKLESSKLEGFTPDHSSEVDENNKIEVSTVLFSNNRSQSLGVKHASMPPVGILSSKKKPFPRRSVAFGSPEAAEYNIGSPSVSLTPMPKGRAKALFTLPGVLSRPREDKIPENEDVTVGLGMNVLIDKITAGEMNGSPELSPIMKDKTPEGNLRAEDNEDSNGKDNSFSGSPSDMRDSSVELTDSESIASIHSKCNKYTSEFVVPFQAQRLDFSIASDASENVDFTPDGKDAHIAETTAELESNMLSLLEATNSGKKEKETRGAEGENTVDLEGNMFSLLEATYGEKDVREGATTDQMELTGVSEEFMENVITKTGIEGEKTVELEGNMFSLLEATNDPKEKNDNDTTNKVDTTNASGRFTVDINKIIAGEKTVELEGNISSLLEATSAGQGERGNDTTDNMDISGESSVLNDNTTVSEQFTGDIKRGIDGDRTVELEGNMFSLLEGTSGGKSEENENVTTDKMDISDESSLMLDDYTTTGDVKTGIEGDKTVELEGNMLSLLDAAISGKDDEKEKDPNDKMDISSSSALKDDATVSEHFTGNLNTIVMNKSVARDNVTKSGPIDESITEVNVMHSRKSATEEELITSLVDLDDDSRIDDGRKRRKSLSSTSFVVHQNDEVQSLVDDMTTRTFEKSVSFSDTAEFISAALGNDTEPESVDISAITSVLLQGLKFEGKGGDILSSSFSRFGKADTSVDRIVFERWGQYIDAVCGEVERRTDLEGKAVSSLGKNVNDDPRFYTMLQKRIQSSQHEEKIKKSMDNLVEAGHKLIEHDWNSWLATVLESFHGPLTATQQMYANDASKLEEAIRHVKKVQDDISLMNDLETKLAREKSIRRQRETAANLEKEIEAIESQLSAAKSELLELEEEELNLVNSSKDQQRMIHDAKLYDELRMTAESSQKNYMSLNGLHSWSMKTMLNSDLEFNTIGSCQQTHLKLMYEGAESGKASKIVSSKDDSAKSRSLYVYHKPLSGFLEASTKRLMETAQQSTATGPVQICEHLQKYTWLAGRLDLIAKEFQVVQRRYNGILHRQSGDVFSFLVEFESERSTVTADFRIECAHYPSFPIEVRLDLILGKQDLDVIKKSLLKNANPGFGSLSRACDIIQSIVRG